MKTILLIAALLITTSAFVRATSYGEKIKDTASNQSEVKKKPDNVLIINLDQLRSKTENVSLLKPLFIIAEAIETATSKLHGRKIKICCNKSLN
jgi:hypothetical protein